MIDEPEAPAAAPDPEAHPAPAPKHAPQKTPPAGRDRGDRAAKPPCLNAPVHFVRGIEEEKFSLTKCDGSPAPQAIDRLSIMLRPGSAQKPTDPVDVLEKTKGPDVVTGIRRVDAKLVERLQQMVTHFGRAGQTAKVFLVSGYRPTSIGSFHADGKAMDFRIDGISNERLVEQCKKLEDTGCGYYPNSSFIHMDVRDAGSGHVSWIDVSGPGEAPRYVQGVPKKDEPTTPAWIADTITKLAGESGWAGKVGY